MAELAAGAVSSLLVVIRNEALLLRGVHGDVQFIKEEMESMNSFLAHLARSAPPSGEHDEQVRTWMNQVRLLAQDCNNCIDLYLYRGNPDIQRARGRIRRHLWWVYWFLHKMVAQHRAAVQLGQLKERARDVGERRLRYGVEVPAKSSAPGQSLHEASAASSSSAQAAAPSAAGGYAAEDDEEDGDDQLLVAATTDHSGQRALFSRTLEDYVKMKLLEWQKEIPLRAKVTLSIGIMAPNAYMDILTIAEETLVFQPGWEAHRTGYNLIVTVDIPAVHPDFLQLRSKEVLFYILHELKLKHSKSQSHEQDTDEEEVQEEENKEEEEEKEKVEEEEEKEEEQGDDDDDDLDFWQVYSKKVSIYGEKKRVLNKIKKNIRVEIMKINKKLDKIKSDIQTRPTKGHQKKGTDQQGQDIHILLKQLLRSSQPYQLRNKDMPKLLATDNAILTVATKLKEYMEADEGEEEGEEKDGANKVVEEREGEGGGGGGGEMVEEEEEREGGGDIGEVEVVDEDDDEDEEEEMRQMVPIHLDEVQYVHILRKLFPKTTSSSNKPATKQTTSTVLGEDQIKQMIHESKHEIIQLLQNGKHDKNQETSELDTQGQNTEDVFTEIIKQKMEKIKQEFKEQLKIKGLVEDIKHELKDESRHSGYKCPLFVLKVDETVDLPLWEDTRKALSLLGCSADVLVVTDTKDIQQAREYCYPKREHIDYSLAGLYYDTVLQITSQQKNEGSIDSQIFRNILKECEPHEFCMKLFTHTLYTNPKRSNEELNKLHKNLQASPKSLDVIAKKIFKFSYSDMPKEYKSCLMYLGIFPPGHKIRRSTLIGRWVAEGLIFREDWPRSVRWANRCFDELMDRWLAYPADIGATGKVKSCVVGDRVHGFITKITRKQHIVETRLSRHLAYHFSIFNDVQLRSSDGIENFFQRLSKSSRVSLLKVLDLEGCQCFGGKNQRYLKDICSKMLLLKYLSLRRTDITQLPSEINNLRELEVLDIRQTQVPEYETRHILLLKMKRLLAGHIDMNLSNSDTSTGIEAKKLVSAVQIPHKIEKMEHMEVLSNVKAKRCRDLRDIGKLWQLRKLGVVIDDNKPSHLKNLLQAISDLHECLCSLSITLPVHYSEESLPVSLTHTPKLLESLSISGNTQKGHLLPLFAGDVNNKLAKVTLSNTTLNQHNLKVLAQLPKLQFVRLRHIAISEDILTIEEDEFENLNYLLVEGSSWTKIIFDGQAVRELKKMVLSFTSIESVSGVDHLQKLEEVELSISGCSSSNNGQLLSSFKNAEQLAKLTIRGTSLEQGGPQIRNQITFNKDEFPKLKHLIVEGSNLTKIIFEPQAARELKKMVLAFTNIESVSGIVHLQKLEEVELSISGSNSNNGGLLSSFNNAKQLAKLAVRGTTLKQVGPQIQNQFTLNKDEFPKLKLLIVDCSAITEIVFCRGSAPKLEKIVWSSFTSLSGIDKLPRLNELEFNGVLVPQEVKEAIRKRKNKPSLKSSEPKIQDQPKRDEQEDDDDAAGFSFCWKKQV